MFSQPPFDLTAADTLPHGQSVRVVQMLLMVGQIVADLPDGLSVCVPGTSSRVDQQLVDS